MIKYVHGTCQQLVEDKKVKTLFVHKRIYEKHHGILFDKFGLSCMIERIYVNIFGDNKNAHKNGEWIDHCHND